MDKITIIVPCYNESESFPFLIPALNDTMNKMKEQEFEIILVDNCSEDDTLECMRKAHADDPRYQYISFSRNFGKDASMFAGLKKSTGDYVTVMDADLQDPLDMLEEMYKFLKESDYDCAAAYRNTRKGEPWLRSELAKAFYKLMGSISSSEMVSGARDFRLMKRPMVNAILELEESVRFTKGIFSWVGFKTKWFGYENKERVAGETKLPMKSAFTYAMRGIVAFSTVPLVAASFMGFGVCVIAVIYLLYVIIKQLILHEAVAGYPSLMCVLLFGIGTILMVLGVIGQYLAQMYLEIKHRPIYITRETSMSEKKE
ncbi:MAG: glycosyltransferase family 2 protein [Lachnospiraceae bacterium]|nr:glycosyltransferase family 2 protein [Lachnospiraceae bacterium]